MANRVMLLPALLGALLTGCSDDPPPKPEEEPKEVQSETQTSGGTNWADILGDTDADEPVLTQPRFLAGGPGNAYYETLRGLRKGFRGKKPVILPTSGSLETLYLVGWGYGDAGIVQADSLQDPRNRAAVANLQVVAPLFVEEIHILVRKDGPRKLSDLAGKQVAVSNYGTGSHLTAENLLDAAGVEDVTLVPTPSYDVPDIISRGDVAALILVGGTPSVDLLIGETSQLSKLRLLDLKASGELKGVLAKMRERNDNYVAARTAYDTLGSAHTVGILSVLVARKDAPAAVVTGLKKGLDSASLAKLHPKGAEIGEHQLNPRVGDDLSVHYRDPSLPLRFATGSTAGTYDLVGDGLERAWEHADGELEKLNTRGSFQNLMLLVSGEAELGIVQEDMIAEALRDPATARLLARVRLVTPLYQEEVHLLVGKNAPAAGVSGLKGKRVAIGAMGSGSMITSLRLLRANRLGIADLQATVEGDMEAMEGIRKGRTHAAILVGGQQLALLQEEKGLKLIPLGRQPGYHPATLRRAGLYEGLLTKDASTVATRALLLCRFDLPDDVVTRLVETLYANRKNITENECDKLAELDKASLAEAPVGLKWHPGVEAARDVEVDSADAWPPE